MERYRVIVFGKGYVRDAAKRNSGVDAEKTRKILNKGGRVSRNEALRCRVRYFSDGAVLGSKEFVQGYFESHRNRFGAKRRDGPRKMRGSDWEGLMCIREALPELFAGKDMGEDTLRVLSDYLKRYTAIQIKIDA